MKKTFDIMGKISFVIVLLVLCLFCAYKIYQKKTGFTIKMYPYNIEKQYGRYLIEKNEEFIDKMILWEEQIHEIDEASSGDTLVATEDQINNLSSIILNMHEIVLKLQDNAPGEGNEDYEDVYKDILESQELFIQGSIMMLQYFYGDTMDEYKTGKSLENLAGNVVVQYGPYINAIKKTDYALKYNAIDDDTFVLNLGSATTEDIQRDENGNLVLSDGTYLYIPDEYFEN